jgi:hypothetical protein
MPVWETRDRLADEIKATRASDPEALRLLANAAEMLTYVARYQNQSTWRFDPNAIQALNDLDAHLGNLAGSVAQIKASPEAAPSLAPRIASALDAASASLNKLPPPILNSGHLKDIAAVTEQHKDALTAALADAQRQAETAVASVDPLRAKVTALTEEIARQETRIIEQSARLDDALNRYGERYETESKAWVATADDTVSDWRAQAADSLTALEQKAAAQRTALEANAEAQLTSLKTMVEDGKSLLDAVARKTISTQYAQYAWRQGVWATIWAVMTVVLAGSGFVFLFMALRDVNQVEAAEAVLKGLASIAVLGAAAYAAAESSGHRQEARDAKRTQLDLNALEPAIARLDASKQAAMRESVLNTVFSRPRPQSSRGRWFGRGQPADVEMFATAVAEAIKKASV